MFIGPGQRGYNRHGEQTASGPFLILFSLSHITHPVEHKKMEIRGCVRHVHMRQLGQFMMARVKVGIYEVGLSGTYGGDGLTCDPDKFPGLWEKLLPLPQELADKMWQDKDGWNSAGSEGQSMHDWAAANIKALRKAGK
jgi:hypothetical protein